MTDDPAGAPPGEQRSRAGRVFFIVAGVVVGIAVLLVIADVVVRNIAEQRVAEQIEDEMPPGVERPGRRLDRRALGAGAVPHGNDGSRRR